MELFQPVDGEFEQLLVPAISLAKAKPLFVSRPWQVETTLTESAMCVPHMQQRRDTRTGVAFHGDRAAMKAYSLS